MVHNADGVRMEADIIPRRVGGDFGGRGGGSGAVDADAIGGDGEILVVEVFEVARDVSTRS